MTKKDYELLAIHQSHIKPNELTRVFATTKQVRDRQALIEQWKDGVNAIAEACAEDNPRFSVELFKEACGW